MERAYRDECCENCECRDADCEHAAATRSRFDCICIHISLVKLF